MLSALCHDFGKALVTGETNGRIHAYEHETAGIETVRTFLHRLTDENALISYVLNMVRLHMRPNMLVDNNSSFKAYMHLFDEAVVPEDLILLAKADYMGSLVTASYEPKEAVLREKLEEFKALMKEPAVKGADLLEAGLKPGPVFRDALDYAHKLHLAGINREEALRQTLGYARKRK